MEEEKTMIHSQKVLQKYEYYYKRFKSHMDAIRFTKDIHDRIENISSKMELDFSFLSETIDKLIEARRVLQWGYVVSYYLKDGNKKNLFEHQQGMLVDATESLQDVMENKSVEWLIQQRNDLVNRTSAMDRLRVDIVSRLDHTDEFDDWLLCKADASLSMWTCSHCKTDNRKEHELCLGCAACVKHGEQDCKACTKHGH